MDDVSVFVTDAVTMCRLVGLHERFGLASSLKVNPRKSDIMPSGQHRTGFAPYCLHMEERSDKDLQGVF